MSLTLVRALNVRVRAATTEIICRVGLLTHRRVVDPEGISFRTEDDDGEALDRWEHLQITGPADARALIEAIERAFPGARGAT